MVVGTALTHAHVLPQVGLARLRHVFVGPPTPFSVLCRRDLKNVPISLNAFQRSNGFPIEESELAREIYTQMTPISVAM